MSMHSHQCETYNFNFTYRSLGLRFRSYLVSYSLVLQKKKTNSFTTILHEQACLLNSGIFMETRTLKIQNLMNLLKKESCWRDWQNYGWLMTRSTGILLSNVLPIQKHVHMTAYMRISSPKYLDLVKRHLQRKYASPGQYHMMTAWLLHNHIY